LERRFIVRVKVVRRGWRSYGLIGVHVRRLSNLPGVLGSEHSESAPVVTLTRHDVLALIATELSRDNVERIDIQAAGETRTRREGTL
jgi:hypothetical protein